MGRDPRDGDIMVFFGDFNRSQPSGFQTQVILRLLADQVNHAKDYDDNYESGGRGCGGC